MVLCDITEALRPHRRSGPGTAPPGQNCSTGVCKAQGMGAALQAGRPAVRRGTGAEPLPNPVYKHSRKQNFPLLTVPGAASALAHWLLENQRVRNIYMQIISMYGACPRIIWGWRPHLGGNVLLLRLGEVHGGSVCVFEKFPELLKNPIPIRKGITNSVETIEINRMHAVFTSEGESDHGRSHLRC